jgi:hypothetical protein
LASLAVNQPSPTASRKWTPNWLRVTLLLSMLAWSSGCATRVVVIPADKQVIPLEAGQTFKAPSTGWWVPDARMQEILHALEAKAKP